MNRAQEQHAKASNQISRDGSLGVGKVSRRRGRRTVKQGREDQSDRNSSGVGSTQIKRLRSSEVDENVHNFKRTWAEQTPKERI